MRVGMRHMILCQKPTGHAAVLGWACACSCMCTGSHACKHDAASHRLNPQPACTRLCVILARFPLHRSPPHHQVSPSIIVQGIHRVYQSAGRCPDCMKSPLMLIHTLVAHTSWLEEGHDGVGHVTAAPKPHRTPAAPSAQ